MEAFRQNRRGIRDRGDRRTVGLAGSAAGFDEGPPLGAIAATAAAIGRNRTPATTPAAGPEGTPRVMSFIVQGQAEILHLFLRQSRRIGLRMLPEKHRIKNAGLAGPRTQIPQIDKLTEIS